MEISEIITSEIKSLISESQVFQDSQLEFTDRIPNVQFTNYQNLNKGFDANIMEANITANWSLSFWTNENGIENMIITINKLSGMFVVELRDKQSDEAKQRNNKDINIVDWKISVNNGILERGGSLYIQSAVFDFSTNTCSISF